MGLHEVGIISHCMMQAFYWKKVYNCQWVKKNCEVCFYYIKQFFFVLIVSTTTTKNISNETH